MKTYVIYNPSDHLSTNLVKDTVLGCESNGLSPILHAGTFGEDIEIKIKKYGIRPSRLCQDVNKGTTGCFLSHYELWLKCASGVETFLILEHDVTMISPLPDNIEELFEDVLHLDFCGSKQKDLDNYLKCIEQKNDLKILMPFNKKPSSLNTWKEAKKNNIPGGYAYLIKPKAAQKLIDAAGKHGFMPADVHINNYYIDLKAISPSIFRICDFMLDRKNRIKFSSTKGYKNG